MSELTRFFVRYALVLVLAVSLIVLIGQSCTSIEPAAQVEQPPSPQPTPEADADSALASIFTGSEGDSLYLPSPLDLSIARALRETSELEGVDPELLARLIRVESLGRPEALGPPITIRLRSGRLVRTRAVGLGQIVPEFWLGVYPECGTDLTSYHTNICYTALIWRHYRDSSPSLHAAALRYNGCYSPHCQWYAPAVVDD